MVPHTFTVIACCVCGDEVGAVFAPTSSPPQSLQNVYCHFCTQTYLQMTRVLAGEINGHAADCELIPTTVDDSTITPRGFLWFQAFNAAITKLEAALTQRRIDKYNQQRQQNST